MSAEIEPFVVPDAAAWRAWLDAHEESSDGVWLVLAKKGTTSPTSLTYDRALDEALCSGWIDGQKRSLDAATFLQRFTPRRRASIWSARNVGIVARLVEESRMRPRGQAEVQDTDGAFTERLSVHPSQYGALDMADFKKALDSLPPDQREAIVLIGASGFSYEEAAEICHCAVGTMKSRVSRARTRLQDLLGIAGEADYGPDAVSAQVTTQSF